jgi:hypothetical protein
MICWRCDRCRWVCESHPDRPWEGKDASGCGAAGMPCRRVTRADPPQLPQEFKIDTDQGWLKALICRGGGRDRVRERVKLHALFS